MQDEEPAWWQSFFDSTYYKLWSPLFSPETCADEAARIIALLDLKPGDHLLDAPCGYGRMALPMATLGLHVTGIDFSADLLAKAEEARPPAPLPGSLHYQQADLRTLTLNQRFSAAIHLFSSLGYGSEDDDLQVLRTIYERLEVGGKLFLDTMHRDAIVHRRSLGQTAGLRGPNGITLREKNRFDPVTGYMHTTWTWNSPTTSGSKHSVIRLYSATEIVKLLHTVGFASVDCVVGATTQPFTENSLSERLGVIAKRSASL